LVARQVVAGAVRESGFGKLSHGFGVGQQFQGVLQRSEFVGADEYRSWSPVARHDNAIVRVFDSVSDMTIIIVMCFGWAASLNFKKREILVGVERLELSASASQTPRATNCATPRCLPSLLAGRLHRPPG
jgi:hypothetical protein